MKWLHVAVAAGLAGSLAKGLRAEQGGRGDGAPEPYPEPVIGLPGVVPPGGRT